MNLKDYRPKSKADFSILLDRFFSEMCKVNPKRLEKNYDKETHLREMFEEIFSMGYTCGQLPSNTPIDLKRLCNVEVH